MNTLLDRFDISEGAVREIVTEAIQGADDGELFVEYSESEALMFDNGRLKTANFNTEQGFGLRAVAGEATGYAHASELSQSALLRAADAVSAVKTGYSGTLAEAPPRTNRHLYGEENPTGSPSFEGKAKLLQEIDGWLRNEDPRVRQVTASLVSSWQHVEIVRADGQIVRDVRPLVRMNVAVVVGDGDRQESGSYGMGGRKGFGEFLIEDSWKHAAKEALRQALVNLEAIPAPAGTFDIVLSSGWPGVMLHEAVGHGLEGDFNRKKTSAFAGLMGQQVAAKGVTVVDDGTIFGAARFAHRRRRRHADQSHGADRGRQAGRLHAGPPERPPDGHERNRQWPARILRAPADAAHDQHLHDRWRTTSRTKSSLPSRMASMPSRSAAARSTSPAASSCSAAPKPT